MSETAAVLGQVAFITLSATGGAALCVIAAALLPERVARSGTILASRPILCVLLGVLLGLPLLVLLVLAANALTGSRWMVVLVPASLLLLATLPGIAAIACAIGRHLGSDRPVPAALRGAPLLALAAAAPVPGWFIVLPVILAAGLGAQLLHRRS